MGDERQWAGPSPFPGVPPVAVGSEDPPEASVLRRGMFFVRSRGRLLLVGGRAALARLVQRDESRYAAQVTVRSCTGAPQPAMESRPEPNEADAGRESPGARARLSPAVLPMPGMQHCAHCGEVCGVRRAGPGRPRAYCSARCRKAAERARRAAELALDRAR